MTKWKPRSFRRRHWLRQAVGLGASATIIHSSLASLLLGQEVPPDVVGPDDDLILPGTKEAIDRGLHWLATRQAEDGAFGVSGYSRNVAVCSLAAMAMISSGAAPGLGAYGEAIDRVIDYVFTHAREDGLISVDPQATYGPMYDHGFATLFLAEVHGMTKAPVRDVLSKAVRLILRTQTAEGGWRYKPVRNDTDLSVTVCQMMALRAARNAGVYVPGAQVAKCLDYVKRAQNEDGGFMYMLEGGASRFARSAAALVALLTGGEDKSSAVERGLAYLERKPPQPQDYAQEPYFLYGHYYAIQVMWRLAGARFRTWYQLIRDILVAEQKPDGHWEDPIGSEFATSCALLVLQAPNEVLPIFQR